GTIQASAAPNTTAPRTASAKSRIRSVRTIWNELATDTEAETALPTLAVTANRVVNQTARWTASGRGDAAAMSAVWSCSVRARMAAGATKPTTTALSITLPV